jgi:hypothetical protein
MKSRFRYRTVSDRAVFTVIGSGKLYAFIFQDSSDKSHRHTLKFPVKVFFSGRGKQSGIGFVIFFAYPKHIRSKPVGIVSVGEALT